MVIVCLMILGAQMCLAVLARMHFSKYKGKPWLFVPWFAMGEFVFEFGKEHFSMEQLRYRTRRLHVLSRKAVDEMVREQLVKRIALILGILCISCLGTIGISCMNKVEVEDTYIIRRPQYKDEMEEQELRLKQGQETYSYNLQVAPRELTQEEFYQQVEVVLSQLERDMLGDNPDADHITKNLCLPTRDDSGVLCLRWQSSEPEMISSSGVVHLEEQRTPCPVELQLSISYLDYEIIHSFYVVVQNVESCENLSVNVAKETLRQIEEAGRNNENIEFPTQIGNVQILFEEKQNYGLTCLVLGVVCASLVIPLALLKEQEQVKEQNAVLKANYCFFVKKMWLLMGTGMSVQRALKEFVKQHAYDDRLIKEIRYALHQLDAGGEEVMVYEELGRQLQIPEYRQLMLHISQYIRVGHNNLQNLMEREMKAAFETRKEVAKQKGEKASTKLLFPMVLLLALVMIMLLYPAMFSL